MTVPLTLEELVAFDRQRAADLEAAGEPERARLWLRMAEAIERLAARQGA